MDNSTDEVLKEYEKATETHSTEHRVREDYSRFDSRSRVQEAVDAYRKVHVRQKPQMPKSKVSVTSIVLYLIIAGFAMLLLNSYVRVTVLTNEITKRTSEYDKLRTEYSVLKTSSEQQYNLNEIEEYAVDVLGMAKVEAGQIEAITITAEESITVIDDEEEDKLSGTFDGLMKKIRSFLEFLT